MGKYGRSTRTAAQKTATPTAIETSSALKAAHQRNRL